jgi:Mce-associated membrane protein
MPMPDRPYGALDAETSGAPAPVAAATRLGRREATAAGDELQESEVSTDDDVFSAALKDGPSRAETASDSLAGGQPWLRRPARRTLAAGAAALVACAGLGASGYQLWYHQTITAEHRRVEEFTAAARQAVTTLMSINADKAREDVQRIIDDSTGPMKARMLVTADDLAKAVERSKVSTTVAVKAVSVQSMSNNSAVVLVAARADASGPEKNKPPPRPWRIVMTLQREGGQLKMANVEMLP